MLPEICHKRSIVAPPRGERGLKHTTLRLRSAYSPRRSPSWGAWIETLMGISRPTSRTGRSPSWGAWIETIVWLEEAPEIKVAPPRGERGLKQDKYDATLNELNRRSPSWGAWIETHSASDCSKNSWSLPLVGSVD